MNSPFASKPAHRNGVPATDQTTVYVTGDNGTYQAGIPHRYEVKDQEQYAGTTNITINGKTDAHTNTVVIDHSFRLMWSQRLSGSVGPTSNGLLPWTTNANGEGVFSYVDAANSAGLGGHADWRLPTEFELIQLCDMEAPNANPNATYFPTWSASLVYSSTTGPNLTTGAMYALFGSGLVTRQDKALTGLVILVRSI